MAGEYLPALRGEEPKDVATRLREGIEEVDVEFQIERYKLLKLAEFQREQIRIEAELEAYRMSMTPERLIEEQTTQVTELKAQGHQLLAKGAFTDAIRVFQKALRLVPRDEDLVKTICKTYAQHGFNLAKGSQVLSVSRVLAPLEELNFCSAESHALLSEAYLRDGKHLEAVAESEKAINHHPEDPSSHVMAIKAYTAFLVRLYAWGYVMGIDGVDYFDLIRDNKKLWLARMSSAFQVDRTDLEVRYTLENAFDQIKKAEESWYIHPTSVKSAGTPLIDLLPGHIRQVFPSLQIQQQQLAGRTQ